MTENAKNVFPKLKFKPPRIILKIGIILGFVLFVVYGYMLVGGLLMLDSKGAGVTEPLIEIAQGSYRSSGPNEFDWDRPAPKTISKKQKCSLMGGEGEVIKDVEFSQCVYFRFWSGGPGCAWWRFEPCDVYRVDDSLLAQPEMLGRVLHALQEPCVYLPKADDFRRAKEQQMDAFSTHDLLRLFNFFACGTRPGHVQMKVIVNIQNDQGDVIAQYQHQPPEAPMFIWNSAY